MSQGEPITRDGAPNAHALYGHTDAFFRDIQGHFVVKDSGKREEFGSGMVRDTSEGKVQYHRVSEGPMLKRWAEHLTKGAVKYPDNTDGSANWTKASGDPEYLRFKQSAFRHFMQWFYGEADEDHAAAVLFNINGAEYVKTKAATLAKTPFARDYSPEKVSMKLALEKAPATDPVDKWAWTKSSAPAASAADIAVDKDSHL